MSFVHSFDDQVPDARFDGVAWIKTHPEESTAFSGTYNALTAIDLPVEPNPAVPTAVDITVVDSSLESAWFRFRFEDSFGQFSPYTDPVQSPGGVGTVYDPEWAPSIGDVADLLYSRTKDRGGIYQGVFTDQTNPTSNRCLHLIGQAQIHVIKDLGGDPKVNDPVARGNAKHMTVIYTAMLIELSHYSEQVTRDISPYKELRKLYQDALNQLEDETQPQTARTALDGDGNPTFGFDGLAVGYKSW